jgi:UDP-glucuronate 4-epimerase
MHVFVTGVAGFVGFHAATALLGRGHTVVGVDEINDYYPVALKEARLARLQATPGFGFVKGDIAEQGFLDHAVAGAPIEVMLHLAAQAGVRYAVENPRAYTRSNLVGHAEVLEFARHHKALKHLVYASSSSVYGNDTTPPFSEEALAVKPVSYYGATKRSCELLSHSYAELYGLKQTGLRFFTVYGPWGRPDMAYWSFTDAVLRGKPLPVFGGGLLQRDFTYVDDIVAGLMALIETPYPDGEGAPHRVYNLGNSHPESVNDLIGHIERATGVKARVERREGPPGDVRETSADIRKANRDFGFTPKVSLAEGIGRFVGWFRQYHNL